uniref:Ribosomal protein S13 n=1 Tax=Galdieria sulphuraria TaxID=130081 RepID=A0A075VZW3_GALSU|nr:ribosomal protein S13 [Galdieria sulphuraria]AIG92501.1 ribosomal protein S13 [Galdieria sulphuraria]
MVRIAGIDLPKNKKVEIALTYIYGIGLPLAKQIVSNAKINSEKKIQDLDDKEIGNIRSIIEKHYQVEGDLRKFESLNIKRLIEIGSYRGKRHRLNLPVRGQRTRTNAKTCKSMNKNK